MMQGPTADSQLSNNDLAMQASGAPGIMYHNGAQAEAHDQDPGIHLHSVHQDPGVHPRAFHPESGLEIGRPRGESEVSVYAAGSRRDEKFTVANEDPEQKSRRQSRRLKILLAVLLCLLAISVAVTGAVLGTRRIDPPPAAAQTAASPPLPGQDSATLTPVASLPTAPPSVPASVYAFASLLPAGPPPAGKRARNGTALGFFTSVNLRDGWYRCLLAYQDQDDKLNVRVINISAWAPAYDASTVVVGEPVELSDVKIAPGSSMGSWTEAWVGEEGYRLVYADVNGTLNEIFSTAGNPSQWFLDSAGFMGFSAPKKRSQMAYAFNRCFGAIPPLPSAPLEGGYRLWLSDGEGVGHHNAEPGAAHVWDSGREPDRNLTAGGPLSFAVLTRPVSGQLCDSSWIMLNTDPDGRLSFFTGTLVGGDTQWPGGPAWNGPYQIPSGPTLAYGSEIAQGWNADGSVLSLFYEEQGRLKCLNATKGGNKGLLFNSAAQSKNVTVMPGSAMAGAYQFDSESKSPAQYMLVFQKSPTSIDWWVKAGDREFTGNILS